MALNLLEFKRPDNKPQFVCPEQVAAVTGDLDRANITLITLASGGAIPVIGEPKAVADKLTKGDGA